ncbi:MMPL family transporter [Candidatus Woesearchaeota archaeon]|nr:MMPL family transporter [Candidatus Woesearchaeota archaeon]
MNRKAKKIFTNFKILLSLALVLFALVAIYPNPYRKGVAIRSVISNSSANLAGIPSPKPSTPPMSREAVISINNKVINDVEDYSNALESLKANLSVQIRTNKKLYRLETREKIEVIELNETEIREIEETIEVNETINGSTVKVNKTITKEIEVPKTKAISLGMEDIGLRVYDAPKTNIRKGLDLQGGTRVLLQPEVEIEQNDMENLLAVMKERLNVYGLSDLVIREAGDLSGNQYILVEIAGATEEEVKDLLAKQGKFEAKIGNGTAFKGGSEITYVCRSADCAGINPYQGCSQSGSQWFCRFRFSISLSPEAAQKQADLTRDLEVVTEDKQQYLSKKLNLFLDDNQVDELRIGAELKGKAETNIQISGSGSGMSQQEAAMDALQNMKRLQTILITGSLPYKLNIVKTDTISPMLGEEFVRNALFIGFLAIFVVAIIVFIRYRKWQVSIPIALTSIAEVVILLGVAALIGWNLDLAAIAGIIIAVGTGVDHKIIITDESLRGEESKQIFNWKERIKGAFFIIIGAYLTTTFAMIPLIFAGAGMLKGFAIVTIIGVSISFFIARTSYSDLIEILLKE